MFYARYWAKILDMKRQMTTWILLMAITATGCKDPQKEQNLSQADVEPATADEQAEWITLFDGTSMDAWKGYNKDGVPQHWKIEGDALVFYPPEDRPEGEHYDLVTREDFGDFVLSLEWRISEGGNSGIFWGVREDPKYHEPYFSGPEIQVLDNQGHPDAGNGTNHQAGSLYDMVAPEADHTRPPGEWNQYQITIEYKANRGMVELNGEKIVSFPLGNASWDEMVAKSKFRDWEVFGIYHKGKIGLQDHGDMVSYRNIRIKPL